MLANLSDSLLKLSFNQVRRSFIFGLLGLTLLFLLVNISLSWQWIDRPFAGFLHINRVIARSNLPGWEPAETRVGERKPAEGDVILVADGQVVTSSGQLNRYLQRQTAGQPLTYLLRSPAGQPFEVTRPAVLFTGQNFVELVIIPAFMATLALLTAAAATYKQADSFQARLFALWLLALVFALASIPELAVEQLSGLSFIGATAGRVVLPALIVHFLLVFPQPGKFARRWPFLLPLVYLPVLPALIYLPTLLAQPETNHPFNTLIAGYNALCVAASVGLLIRTLRQSAKPLVRKQTAVLLLGLILPSFLGLTSYFIMARPLNWALMYETLNKYSWIGLPFGAAIALVRYQLFDLKRSDRLHVLYTGASAATIVSYFLLVALINPTSIRLSYIRLEDVRIIAGTVMVFFVLQPLYSLVRQRLERRLYGSIEDFRIGLRLFQQELLKIKSRHDLEALVSWNIPADFRLRSAEMSQRGRPSSPYSLQLPIMVNNVSLGTLFFGGKINGEEFTERERLILVELQKQLSLALWSLELDAAIRTTEELTRLKSKFMANVTHELRTPLNGIINYIGIVIDGDTGPLNPEQSNHLNHALQSSEKLLSLINNILDMSKIDAGQMGLRRQQVNLAQVVSEAVPLVTEMLCDKPVRLLTDLAATLPDISADRLRLRQIIMNLLSNAAKFTDSGIITLKAYPENGHVIIQVRDTGRGIKAELLPTVFQQFTGERLADRAEHSGAGLSLPVTKSLVEMHGGHIEVESQVGRGTTFTVTWPAEQNTNTRHSNSQTRFGNESAQVN